MRSRLRSGALLAILAVGVAGAAPPAKNAITAIRHWTLGDVTRVVVETTEEFEFERDRVPNPDRLFFDLAGTRVRLGKKGMLTFPVNDPRLKQIRVAETMPGVARVVFDLEDATEYTASMLSNPPRLIVELKRTLSSVPPGAPAGHTASALSSAPVTSPPASAKTLVKTAEPPVTAARTIPTSAETAPGSAKVTAPPSEPPVATAKARSQSSDPSSTSAKATVPAADPLAGKRSTPQPANLGASTSMTRVLGLKIGRIVLDPGHGGHDTGTIGRGGLMEKDLALEVCKLLGALIETRLGAEVIYTRSDDTFIPLERRTEIANESKADLFLSIHANSSPVVSSSGVETYYLNFTTSREAMQVAARENASSQKTVYELTDLLQKIALQDKVEESRQFASRIQQAVYSAAAKSNSRVRNRGVRKAPFVVLIGASMPSVLAEVGFISNPRDESLFRRSDFRQKIAEALYQGLSRYASTLSQFQVARK